MADWSNFSEDEGENEIFYVFHQVSDEVSIYEMLEMFAHPDYEWMVEDDCEPTTNGHVCAWKLVKKESDHDEA